MGSLQTTGHDVVISPNRGDRDRHISNKVIRVKYRVYPSFISKTVLNFVIAEPAQIERSLATRDVETEYVREFDAGRSARFGTGCELNEWRTER